MSGATLPVLESHISAANINDSSSDPLSLWSRQGTELIPFRPFGSSGRARPWYSDVVQDPEEDNCWIMAILQVLAARHPEHIESMFVIKDGEYTKVLLPAGCVDVDPAYLKYEYSTMIFNGKW